MDGLSYKEIAPQCRKIRIPDHRDWILDRPQPCDRNHLEPLEKIESPQLASLALGANKYPISETKMNKPFIQLSANFRQKFNIPFA